MDRFDNDTAPFGGNFLAASAAAPVGSIVVVAAPQAIATAPERRMPEAGGAQLGEVAWPPSTRRGGAGSGRGGRRTSAEAAADDPTAIHVIWWTCTRWQRE